MITRLASAGLLLGALALGGSACGDDDDTSGGESAGGAKTLTIYSSLPLQGALRPTTTATVNGIKLALKEAGSKAGDFKIRYESLDDSTAQAGNWTPEATGANARKAAGDDSAIAYIGEFNSGATAISLPILNEVPLMQISPSNTAVGLTTDEPGADKGEPDKYYPTGEHNYARIVPKDTIQGAALATVMKKDGCANVYILNDKEVYGAGLARNIESSAKEQGVQVLHNGGIDPKAPNFRSLAEEMKAQGTECFVFSGTTPNGAVQLFKDVHAALPDALLYGPDGCASSSFTDPKEGGIPADVQAKTKLTVATLSPDQYPPEGRTFFKEYTKEYGDKTPDPYAIYGYEAARLALDVIERAGAKGNDRQAVIDELYRTSGRKSVLGTYDIDENGDTTLTDYGVYTVKGGQLTFDETIKAG